MSLEVRTGVADQVVEVLSIRPARLEDLEALYALSVETFPADPWSPEGLREEILRDTSLCRVADGGAAGLAGFLIAWRVLDELHLLHIATRPAWRRQGIGARLLRGLLEEGRASGASVVYLEVRASNEAARALYEREGFQRVGVRKGYYSHPREDAILMMWSDAAPEGH